ncbi:MAG: hypothetical protein WKF93_01695 [Acidimicrobiales bacterium]
MSESIIASITSLRPPSARDPFAIALLPDEIDSSGGGSARWIGIHPHHANMVR